MTLIVLSYAAAALIGLGLGAFAALWFARRVIVATLDQELAARVVKDARRAAQANHVHRAMVRRSGEPPEAA